MRNLSPRMVLACVFILMFPVAGFGQQTANQEANAQYAVTYIERGVAKQKKGDLDGAMADYNQAMGYNLAMQRRIPIEPSCYCFGI
jgi:hypothetical protein